MVLLLLLYVVVVVAAAVAVAVVERLDRSFMIDTGTRHLIDNVNRQILVNF